MSSEYAIRALRDTANELRSKAAAHYASKEIEARQMMELARRDADEMVAAAAEIDADANAKEQLLRPAAPAGEPVPCWNCGQPVMKDQLGWRHAPGRPPNMCQVPGPSDREHDQIPADPQDPAVTRTDGEVPGNA